VSLSLLHTNLEAKFLKHNYERTIVYPKVSGLSHKEIYAYFWYYLLRRNIKGYGDKTH